MSDVTGLAVVVAEYGLLLALIGFMTIKALVWGGASVLTLWMGAPLVDSFTRAELLADLVPRFYDIAMFYPQFVVPEGLAIFDSHIGGFLGAAIAVTLIIAGVIPYSIGLFLGATAWPETLLLRVVI